MQYPCQPAKPLVGNKVIVGRAEYDMVKYPLYLDKDKYRHYENDYHRAYYMPAKRFHMIYEGHFSLRILTAG
jgi:hypothetical protein